jgi:hypothetical protein
LLTDIDQTRPPIDWEFNVVGYTAVVQAGLEQAKCSAAFLVSTALANEVGASRQTT